MTADVETPPAEAYQATDSELAVLNEILQDRAGRPPRVRVVQLGDSKVAFIPDHPDPDQIGRALLMRALGTIDKDFLDGLLHQLWSAASQGRLANDQQLNFMLAVVQGIEPRDQIEVMLAAQMAAVQVAIMRFA